MSTKRTDNHGSLSRNKKKEKETHPTHKGSCTIEGREYWISAYVNESRQVIGEKYFKLYFEAKKTEEGVPNPDIEPCNPDIEPW